MAAPDAPVNLDAKLALISDHWSPKAIGEINDLVVKLVKVQGEFVWHEHDDTDEFFLVWKGELTIEVESRSPVTLTRGDFFVVPRGVRHRPVATDECEILLLEPRGVVNTGEVDQSELTTEVEWI